MKTRFMKNVIYLSVRIARKRNKRTNPLSKKYDEKKVSQQPTKVKACRVTDKIKAYISKQPIQMNLEDKENYRTGKTPIDKSYEEKY